MLLPDFRHLLEHSADLTQRVSPGSRFPYVNPAWRERLGPARMIAGDRA